jgi:hypothetical protein
MGSVGSPNAREGRKVPMSTKFTFKAAPITGAAPPEKIVSLRGSGQELGRIRPLSRSLVLVLGRDGKFQAYATSRDEEYALLRQLARKQKSETAGH